jgi:predicted NAD-dependent protein-ADP-ribosyltransferase YbiA (DUF1768 family)
MPSKSFLQEAVKDNVMRDAVRAGFTQHAELRALLLDTSTGRILMEVRDELRDLGAEG